MARKSRAAGNSRRPQGIVLWRGPSRIDGKPVVAIATGLRQASSNRVTGPAIQVWIMRSHVHPLDAVRRGQDRSVCGECLHRGITCYVQVWREVGQVYQHYRRGKYPDFQDWMLSLFQHRPIRCGAYGDPAAVPVRVWRRLRRVAGLWLCYTHQWDKPWCDPALRDFCMASVDSPEQRERALALGWKTFRIRTQDEPMLPGEFVCPKSAEAGRRLLCIQCGACQGGDWTGQATPATIVHGLPALQARFAADARRFALSLPVLGRRVAA